MALQQKLRLVSPQSRLENCLSKAEGSVTVLKSLKQAKFLFDNIKIDGKTEVIKVTRIYTTYTRERLFASSARVRIVWQPASPGDQLTQAEMLAMVFVLTNDLQVFRPNNSKQSVWRAIEYRPWL